MQIMRAAENVCERDFDVPQIRRSGGEISVSLRERARLYAEVGAEQIICSSGGTMCGDSYNWFNDGKGRLIMVLSDGMGTGGRAAVDSAMATGLIARLIKAGFGFDSALKILNSSMLFKSTDESLATVDVACLDLFTGKLDLMKAGAAPTFVRRNGKTGKAQSTSLPAGILREIGFDKGQVSVSARDIILMVSDGVTGEDNEWICEELEKWGNDTAQHLSEHIAHLAREKRGGGHSDDITVIAAIISRA
jgi:stage II sporulation protein E